MALKQQRGNCRILRSVWVFAIVVSFMSLYLMIVEAQFFTKSSKSIPRMGRRSSESPEAIDQYKRQLIDNLVDEYGPSLLEKLQSKATEDNTEDGHKNNEPIVDWSQAGQFYQMDPILSDDYAFVLSREELPKSARATKINNRESNSALQASNTNNRLMHYLSPNRHSTLVERSLLSNAKIGGSGMDK